jgi:hypothetical protein
VWLQLSRALYVDVVNGVLGSQNQCVKIGLQIQMKHVIQHFIQWHVVMVTLIKTSAEFVKSKMALKDIAEIPAT